MSDAERSWYLLYTKARSEHIADENLRRQGYETYLPLARAKTRRRGHWVTAIQPLFPRYLFIHLSQVSDNWGPIRSTLGVTGVVRFGLIPARVPARLIESLRSHAGPDGFCDVTTDAELRPGERVQIAGGPLFAYEAVVLSRSADQRVRVLLELADKYVRVELGVEQLMRVVDL